MGKLIDGNWVVKSVATNNKSGEYERIPRSFRNTISSSDDQFKPESGRYHLYVSYACPWAHRTLIYRSLKDLEEHISVSVVSPDMLDDGWVFDDKFPGATVDHINGFKFLRDVYLKADAHISTSVTVPILWDKKLNTIVNNESSEIIRILNSGFNELTGNTTNFYPKEKQTEIDELNDFIYPNINNGVYRTGFASSQEAYSTAVTSLFDSLDRIESILEGKQYLVADALTEADIRLITTLLRFDIVYYGHFKCNIRQIKDYKNLSSYVRRLYEIPGIKKTTNLEHIKRHYYYSHDGINPFRIVPLGPDVIF